MLTSLCQIAEKSARLFCRTNLKVLLRNKIRVQFSSCVVTSCFYRQYTEATSYLLENKTTFRQQRNYVKTQYHNSQINDMSPEKLIDIMSQANSGRMDICLAGERLLLVSHTYTEPELNIILKRLMVNRFSDLSSRLLTHFYSTQPSVSIHSGLSKTALRLVAEVKDRALFLSTASHIIPDLIKPDSELSGVYVRALLSIFGYDAGMQYFLSCNSTSSRYGHIVPDMIYGLYENHFYSECLTLYNSICDQCDWKHIISLFSRENAQLGGDTKDVMFLRHPRIYAGAIGSCLALDDTVTANVLYGELRVLGLTPLRETCYDILEAGDRACDSQRKFNEFLSRSKEFNLSYTDFQKDIILSLAKCAHFDSLLPIVLAHNAYRSNRQVKEDALNQIIYMSVRLTPVAYQRMELYRVLKGMEKKNRQEWYDGCLLVKTEKDITGITKLLSVDIQPAVEFKLLDYDQLRIEFSSVYNWLDIQNRLSAQFR